MEVFRSGRDILRKLGELMRRFRVGGKMIRHFIERNERMKEEVR